MTNSDAAGTVSGFQTSTMGGLIGVADDSTVESSNAFVTLIRLCNDGSDAASCDTYAQSTNPTTPRLIGLSPNTTVSQSALIQ